MGLRMFPLTLAVLNGIVVPHLLYSLFRTVSITGNIPSLQGSGLGVSGVGLGV